MSILLALGDRQKGIYYPERKRKDQGLEAVAKASIALMNQTWRAEHKKPFYNLLIITLA